jgi:hypothetical protein
MAGYGGHCACPCVRKISECAALPGRGQSCGWETIPEENRLEERRIFFELATLARIKGSREEFCIAGHWMVLSLLQAFVDREDYVDDAFLAAEDAIRAAADAVSALNEKQKTRIGHFFTTPRVSTAANLADGLPVLRNWPLLLSDLIKAFALCGWENPTYVPRVGAGAREGRRADFPFRSLVFGLLLITSDFGGKLTLDHKRKSGTLLQALGLLRPYSVFDGIIPVAPPISTIRRVVEDFRLPEK